MIYNHDFAVFEPDIDRSLVMVGFIKAHNILPGQRIVIPIPLPQGPV